MKLLLTFGLFLLSLSSNALDIIDSKTECIWRNPSNSKPYPQIHTCSDGHEYYFGTQTCGTETLRNAFCNKKFSGSVTECKKDFNSSATRKCYENSVAFLLDPKLYENKKADGQCRWGWAGGENFSCGKKTYLYGKAKCTSGVYRNIFCGYVQASHGGRTCAEDRTKETIECYKKFVEKNPEYANAKQIFTPKGGKPVNIPKASQ